LKFQYPWEKHIKQVSMAYSSASTQNSMKKVLRGTGLETHISSQILFSRYIAKTTDARRDDLYFSHNK